MNLAEQVRQVHELKKAYEVKIEILTIALKERMDKVLNSQSVYSGDEGRFIGHLKNCVDKALGKNQDTIYMLESLEPRNWSENDFLSHVTIFRGFRLKLGYALAKSHGFLVEVIDLPLIPPENVKYVEEFSYTRTDEWCFERYNLPRTIKALKITWGE